MLERKAIERDVGVHGVDDPVAITPGFAKKEILIEPVGVGIASEIEPMATPAFAKLGRGKQSVNDALEGAGAIVGFKGSDIV